MKSFAKINSEEKSPFWSKHAEVREQEREKEREFQSMGYQVEVEEHMVEYGEKKIYGMIYRPACEGTFGAVILSHGYNGSHSDFDFECRELAGHGYVAYAFDFWGGSGQSKSSKNTEQMTVFTEKEDLLAVLEDIRSLPIVDKDQMFLFGGSQGGFVSGLAAEERKESVKAMVLYYPAFNIPDDWRKNFKREEDIPEKKEFWGMMLGRDFFLSIRNFQTFEEIGEYRNPVLIIYGEEDPIVPLGAMEKAEQTYRNVRLQVLEKEGHGFSTDGRRKAMDSVLEFLEMNR